MVDSANGCYLIHGHHRSLSSLASSIMPITSDSSTTTSLTASPIDPNEPENKSLDLLTQKNAEIIGEEVEDPTAGGRVEVNPAAAVEKEIVVPQREESAVVLDERSHQSRSANGTFDGVSFADLVDQAREEASEGRRLDRLRKQVAKLKTSNGINRRLHATSTIAYSSLIDQFKGDDQAGFTGLFEASERLSSHCASSLENLSDKASTSEELISTKQDQYQGFQVAVEDAEPIVSFLNKIRTDLDYLSTLIAELPSTELSTLTSCYHPAGVELSILPNHSHGRTSAYSRDSQMMKLSRRMDNIDLFHNKDPYFTLLHTIFDSSAVAGSQENRLRREVWARTCARVVTDGKEGTEEFIIATIDAFTSTDDWDSKDDTEIFIMDVLAEGWFILDPPLDEPDEYVGSNWEPERASHAISVAEFFDRHAENFLKMMATKERTPLPITCLDFIRLILSHIESPQTRELATKFIVSRWYFASFITSLLVYPEVRGLSLDRHIGDSARQKILHRLALHIQSQVFSVLAPSSALTYILPEVREHVLEITKRFEHSSKDADTQILGPSGADFHHLEMSPWEIIGLVDCLHPDIHDQRQAATAPGSSISGTSMTTLRPISAGNDQPMTDVVPHYSESMSTDSTYVDDSSPYASMSRGSEMQDRDDKARRTGPFPSKPVSRLIRAISSLRSSASSLNRGRLDYSCKEWVCFSVDPSDSLLKLEPSFIPQLGSVTKLFRKSAHDIQESSNKDYDLSRDAILSLLSSSLDHPQIQQRTNSFAPLFEAKVAHSKARHNFKEEYSWWQRLVAYKSFERSNGSLAAYNSLSKDVGRLLDERLHEVKKYLKRLEDVLSQVEILNVTYLRTLKELSQRRTSLRVKMWYASDVKNSGPYEDALRVTRALRAMANPKKPKQASGFASWARQRLRGTPPYDRADKQALEAMSAPKDEGGMRKLGDDQIDLTSRWIAKNSIVTFCQGEERIHRFSYEVQKLVQKLAGTGLLESPVLWSSHFFRQEKKKFEGQSIPTPPTFTPPPITPPLSSHAFANAWSPQRQRPSMALDRLRGTTDFNGLQITSSPYSGYATVSGRHETYKSVLPNSTLGYLSPPMTPVSPRPVEVFNANVPSRIARVPKVKQDFVDDLRAKLLGLVTSDLGYLLWANGSETDAWIKKVLPDLNAQMSDPMQMSTQAPGTASDASPDDDQIPTHFDFSASYAVMLSTMSLTQDPRRKLAVLADLQDLISSSHESPRVPKDPTTSKVEPNLPSAHTSTTKIADQCIKRFASSVRHKRISSGILGFNDSIIHQGHITFPPNEIIQTLQNIFSNPSLRPPTLFRDLQTIASLIPSSTLDHTSEGSAFWTASIAALSFKDTLVSRVVSRAQAITDYHLSVRATHPPLLPPTDKDALSDTSLQDAANLWLIAAKEGNITAARELALFYLTHPELLHRTTAPMAKAKDVFITTTAGGAALDPKTFCVVLHWMQTAAAGGDQQAIEFLRENNGKKA